MTNPRHPRTDPDVMTPGRRGDMFNRAFRAVFLVIAILGIAIWLAIFEYNYHPRLYRYNADVMILQVGDSELDFNHPAGAFSLWWQTASRNVRLWPR